MLSDEALHAMAASQSDDPFTDVIEERIRRMTLPCKHMWWLGSKKEE